MLAVIGSPSSTTQITLNLLTESYRTPVYGQLVGFTHELLTSAGSHRELPSERSHESRRSIRSMLRPRLRRSLSRSVAPWGIEPATRETCGS